MKKLILIGKIYDPVLDCCHMSMEIDDSSEWFFGNNLQDAFYKFNRKKVKVTIEEMKE